MSGKRIQKPPRGQMARRLVYYCISVLSVTALWAAVMKTIDHTIDLSDVLTFVGGVFGGELLFLVIKRVFAKKEDSHDYDETI